MRKLLSFSGLLGFCLLALAGMASSAVAQNTAPGEWTWVGGSSTLGATGSGWPGVYGTLGTPAAGNIPGSRYGSLSWTDNSGHFWLFGGQGYGSAGTGGPLIDLWEFDPSSNEWVWMSGSSAGSFTQTGVYGTLGTPAAGNTPGGRQGAAKWTDSSGNLWLFGGAGINPNNNEGLLNDLWEYNISSNQWTWMSGCSAASFNSCSTFGVYGTLGTPSAESNPGARSGATSWIDSSGHLWLFGGWGLPVTTNLQYFGYYLGGLNDLWEFNPSTRLWTWMGGSQESDQAGTYGTLGTPSTGNIPGARYNSATWSDNNGHFWLFGGSGYDSRQYHGQFNDLWEFNSATQQWTWMSGSGQEGQTGVYGTLGSPAAGNIPGARESAATWVDSSGQLWLFGGMFLDSGQNIHELNDLWKFNPSTSQWAWMGGSIADPSYFNGLPGVFGTLGTPAAGNVPGSRLTAANWTDIKGNFWLFGGLGMAGLPVGATSNYGDLNDLWVYQPSSALSLAATPPPVFSPVAGTYTRMQLVSITDSDPNAVIYYTTDGTAPTTSSTKYTFFITVAGPETIRAFAVAPNYLNSAVVSAAYTLPDFSFAANTSSLTVLSGQTGTVTLTLTPQNGFNTFVSFGADGLPTGFSWSFSPATITPSGSPVTATLTITAPAATTMLHRNSRPLFPGSVLAIALCCFGWKRRRCWSMPLLLLVSAMGLTLVSSCGGGGSSASSGPPAAPTYSSTLTLYASTGQLSHNVTVTLIHN